MAKNKRLLALLGVVVVVVLVFALYQMGALPFGGAEAEEAGTTPSTEQATTATSLPPASAAAGAAAKYAADLHGWMATSWADIDAKVFKFKKATRPTAKEIVKIQVLSDQRTKSVAALEAIVPPDALGEIHVLYVATAKEEATALQRVYKAIKNKNWRDMELAVRDMNTAHTLGLQAVSALDTYVKQYAKATTPTTAAAATSQATPSSN